MVAKGTDDASAPLNCQFDGASIDTECNENTPLVRSAHQDANMNTAMSHISEGSVNLLIKSGKQLKKSLGFKHAFSYMVGLLLSSGVFISPSLVARETSNMGMALIVWVISGIPCILGALCFCELACMHRKAGGEYVYILEAFGKLAAFLTIWAQVIAIMPLAVAVIALTIGENVVGPFYDVNSTSGMWLAKAVAIASILLSLLLNCISTNFSAKIQVLVTAVQYLSISFLVVLGIWRLSQGHTENYTTMFKNSTDFNVGTFGLAIYNSLWAYDGWGLVSCVSEELKNLERDLWLSIVTGIPFVIVCYIVVNLALMSALTHDQIANSRIVTTTFVEKCLGQKASLVIPIAVGISCFGCVSGNLFVLSRVVLSAAREGQMPKILSLIHRTKRTPVPALIFLSVLSIFWLLPSGNGLETLITYFSFAIWLTYGAAIFSVIFLRIRMPDMPRPFKVWIINPIFASLFSLFLVIIPFVKRPVASSITLCIMLTGLPVYYVFIRRQDKLPLWFHKSMEKLTAFIKVKGNLTTCVFEESS